MATLNLSSDGPAINRSYRSIVDAPLPTGSAASSTTYGLWAVYTVAAPLVSAFQQDSGKESVLKVQSTGEGELVDLIDEFSEGRIQFAFLKIKDPNTTLAKCVLIAWCGEGVPERTKGYFTSHLTAVSKLLHGYHVQITARSDRDLTPDTIVRKVADASGSKYSGDPSVSSAGGPPPPVASKPVFMPTAVASTSRGFNPLGSRTRAAPTQDTNVDADGWGEDAPPVTRTQLEKVAPAYQPTRVNMADLTSQKPTSSRFDAPVASSERSDVVRGGYQPVGKVDIAAIRRQAQESGSLKDDRPVAVKGAYEPVGKVDIAAIKARSQRSSDTFAVDPSPPVDTSEDEPKSLVDRSAAFTQSERLTSMPKPKPAKRFGSGASNFTGTKAPIPAGDSTASIPATAPVGLASKNFADEGGKTPAQLWAERKARERGNSGAAEMTTGSLPIRTETSGGAGWESGYSGKKWAPVHTTRTGASAGSVERENEPEEEHTSQSASVNAMRDRFSGAPPPPMDFASKPNAGTRAVPPPPPEEEEEESGHLPTPPPQPRMPTPEPSGSPIRVAMPVPRTDIAEMEPPEERLSPPTMPTRSMAEAVPDERDLEPEPRAAEDDTARASSFAAARAAAATGIGALGAQAAGEAAPPPIAAEGLGGGKRALVQYDYEKAEDNELELREGEYVYNIEMVDTDWWMGESDRGEKGLFPANYVELVEDDHGAAGSMAARPVPEPEPAPEPHAHEATHSTGGRTGTAQFDYEAAEENELSFPEGAKVTNISFPDEDWWLGTYNGREGLFPGNYIELDH